MVAGTKNKFKSVLGTLSSPPIGNKLSTDVVEGFGDFLRKFDQLVGSADKSRSCRSRGSIRWLRKSEANL